MIKKQYGNFEEFEATFRRMKLRVEEQGSGTFRRRRFGAGQIGAGHFGAGTIRRQNFFFWVRCSVATLLRFVARFARGRIENSN